MRALATTLLTAALIAVLPSAAMAHATLEQTSPERGAELHAAPGQVVLTFDEPVEAAFGAIRVYDATGKQVERGKVSHPDGDGPRIAIGLADGLHDGTYTTTYRVVSADGHVVQGGFVFSVGRPSAVGRTVDQLLSSSSSRPVTATAFTLARALTYLAIALAAGALLLLLWLFPRAPAAAPLLVVAAILGGLATVAMLVLEAAQAAGVSAWATVGNGALGDVAGTRFGTVWLTGLIAWLVIAVAGAWRRWQPPWGALPPLVYLAMAPALSGHAASRDTLVLFPANVLHVASMAIWVGGLIAILVVMPRALRDLDPKQRTHPLYRTLSRFSSVALVAVAVLAVTGLVQAYVEIRRLDLVLDTPFGRAVLIKLALLLALIGLGALHRRRNLPRLRAADESGASPGEAGRLVRGTILAELVLIAAVLVTTGALAGYAPADTARSGPVNTSGDIGDQRFDLTIDPAAVGPNVVHLYLTDPKTGTPVDTAREVDIDARLPAKGIGPIAEQAQKSGPGHYTVPALTLGVAGKWQLTLTVRVSAFDEDSRKLEVDVR